MINIPKNEYVQPTEVREEVVQAICEAFIKKGCDSTFHPHNGSNRGCRDATLYVAKPTRKGVQHVWRFQCSRYTDSTDISYRIRGVEMKRAFEELIKAGYYMFRVWSYGSWLGYVCHDRPFYYDGYRAEKVESFNDRID